MGIAAVTILILSMMILALTAGIALIGQWCWRLRERREIAEQNIGVAEKARDSAEKLFEDLQQENLRLRTQLQQIPLTPRPKETNNGVQQAKNSGDVRRLTEKAWGTNPNDRN